MGITKKKLISIFLISVILVLFISQISVLSDEGTSENGIVVTCASRVAPYAIFEQSEGVNYTTNTECGNYNITDYYGQTVKSGNFSDSSIHIDGLKLGRFVLNVSSSAGDISTPFSVVPDVDKRRDSTNSAFGFSTMATHTYSSVGYEDAYAKTIQLAGVHYVRDFVVGNEILASIRDKKLMNAYNKYGINVMFNLQAMPGGTGFNSDDGKEDGHAITRDMMNVYNTVETAFATYGNLIDTFEILNEVEIGVGSSSKDGPDLYAAFLKTAAIAAAECDPDVLIASEGAAKKPYGYTEKLLSNQISEYIDVYTTHHYESAPNREEGPIYYPDDVSDYMFDAKEYGLLNKNLWMSEMGLSTKYNTGEEEMDDVQQKCMARSLPVAFIRGQAAGVDKMFWFLHGYRYEKRGDYDADTNNWVNGFNTLDKEHRPQMSYSAFSALTNAIGNAEYYGKFNNLNDSDLNGYCYADGDTQIGCFWADQGTGSKSVTLNVNNGKITVTDIMGNEQEITAENGQITIQVGNDIQYVRAENGFASGIVTKQVKTDKDYKKSKFTKAKKIVMLPLFEDTAEENCRDRAYILSKNSVNNVKLRIYNFNSEEMSGKINVTAPSGWSVDKTTVDVDILPMEYEEISFKISGSNNDILPLIFSGEFGGEKTSDTISYITTRIKKENESKLIYTYKNDISLTDINYENNKLIASFNTNIKSAKYLIDGKTYDAVVDGNKAELDVALGSGEHNVCINAFDNANMPAMEYTTRSDTYGSYGYFPTYFERSIMVERSDDECVISYNANGGGNAPDAQITKVGEETNLSYEIPYKRNYIFMGWAYDENTKIADFNVGDKISISEDTTLYAVWEENEEEFNSHFSYCKSDWITISGKTDVNFSNRLATFVVFDGLASPENLSESDIVYLGETQIDYKGNYQIIFKANGLGFYRYVLNIGGEIIDSDISEYSSVYDLFDSKLVVTQSPASNTLTIKLLYENVADEDCSVKLIIAAYSADNSLLDVRNVDFNAYSGRSSVGVVYDIPEDTATKKIFLWAAGDTLTPLQEAVVMSK